jgi:hypothetical protein
MALNDLFGSFNPGSILNSLGLDEIFEPILKPIRNIFGSVKNLIIIIVCLIIFFKVVLPILKWLFGWSKPAQPIYYPAPMYYPPMSNLPMSYPPAPK